MLMRNARHVAETCTKEIRRLSADQRGAAIIEFAAVAPPFFFLMIAIAQVALVFLANLWLDNAATMLAREVRTGLAQGRYANAGEVKQAVCDRSGGFIACDDRLLVDVRALNGPVSLTWPLKPDGTLGTESAYTPGAPGQLMLVRLFYQHRVLIPAFWSALKPGVNGQWIIVSSTAFRNEPFAPAQNPPPAS